MKHKEKEPNEVIDSEGLVTTCLSLSLLYE